MCDLQGIFAAKCALLLSIRVDWWRELTRDKGLFGGNNRRNEQRGSDHETRNALGAPSNVSRIGVVCWNMSTVVGAFTDYQPSGHRRCFGWGLWRHENTSPSLINRKRQFLRVAIRYA